jgi:hypothetical protein
MGARVLGGWEYVDHDAVEPHNLPRHVSPAQGVVRDSAPAIVLIVSGDTITISLNQSTAAAELSAFRGKRSIVNLADP